ncbi:hypothetical protein ACLI4Z_07590 [Natrialbaceae archaeon A-arb3/5]
MVVSNSVTSRLAHVTLTAGGLAVLFGFVIVTVVAVSTLAHVVFGLLLGVPITAIGDIVSISQIATDRTDDPFSWIAGILLCIVLLPYFDRYHRWTRTVLRDKRDDVDC